LNVYDFPSIFTEEHVPRTWEYIFERQHELTKKYIIIEEQNNLRWTIEIPVDLDTGRGQAQLKDMAWRIIEEVGESLEAYLNLSDDPIHAKEELADGLHFLVELLILSGLTYKDVEGIRPQIIIGDLEPNIDECVSNVVLKLGTAMNCLKLKPWKQTHVKIDKEKYHKKLIETFEVYVVLMLKVIRHKVDILNLYFSKSSVNEFRIESKY